MRYLYEKRKELGLTQVEVASQCQMSPQRLQQLEAGVALPTPAQASKLAAVLGIRGLPTSDDPVSDKLMQRTGGSRPYQLEVFNPETWQQAGQTWAYSFARLRIPAPILEWMSNWLRCDSGREAFALAQLAGVGARPFTGNPHFCGFRQHPVTDSVGKVLGERHLAGLSYEAAQIRYWYWPQVHLRTQTVTFRLDGLVLFKKGRRRRWLMLEYDGKGHHSENDDYRSERIGLPPVRITGDEITRMRVHELLLARAETAKVVRIKRPEDA